MGRLTATFIWLLNILFSFCSNAASAYEGERLKQNIGQDYVNCAGFYTIAAELYAQNSNSESEKQFRNLATTTVEMGLTVFAPKVFEAKAELVMDSMKNAVREEGFSRLILQYGQLCKSILENPVERMRYWKEKQ